MINSGSQYSEVVSDAMNNSQQESNTHIVNEFARHNHTFIITEIQSPLQTLTPPGRFRVTLQSQKCDCGEYQAKHLPCSHVMTVCKSVNLDPMNYLSMLFTLQHILHVYEIFWINVARIWTKSVGSSSKKKEDCKGSSHFNLHSYLDGRRRKWTQENRKKCRIFRQHHNRNNCLIISPY